MSQNQLFSFNGRRYLRPNVVALSVVLLLVAAACGTRQSRHEVEAAAQGSPGGVATSADSSVRVTTHGEGLEVADETTHPDGSDADTIGAGSGSTGSDAAGVGVAESGTVQGAGAPIVIGSVSTLSGIAGSAQVPGVRAAQAWVASVNARGGINGHEVRYVVVDDASDPARHSAAVKDLVENKGVIAFMTNYASLTAHAARDYLEQRQIPVVGGDSSTSVWFESPMYFPVHASPDDQTRARLKALAELSDKTKIGTLVCQEASVCREQAEAVKRHASEFGFEVVYEGQGSLAQPDYTAACLSARNSAAEVILFTFDANTMRRIAQSCDRQNYRPHYDLAIAMDPDIHEVPSFQGATVAAGTFPFTGSDSPVVREFHEALALYAPDQRLQPVAATGWAGAKVFEKVATAAFPPGGAPSSAALLEALWSIRDDNFGGLTGPVSFRKGQPVIPHRCVTAMVVQGGGWVAPNGLTMTCVSQR